jgi:O-acetyl-ADP-ribose deacetylase (regulator of RNase III)
MIKLTQGDILKARTDALVNTVNCVGVMGRGVALQFRKAFPDNFQAYKQVCDRKQLHPGQVFVYDLGRLEPPRYVINFPTKRHWKGKSKLADIQAGLEALVREIQDRGIRSVAVPPLGCGLGGLDWRVVRPMIEKAFASLPEVHVEVYEPKGTPEPEAMVDHTETPGMTPGRAALLGLMRRYLGGLMDTSVSLLEIHKLMYFLQETGEPLRLDYVKALYGPYAKNLRHVLTRIEGHFVTGYGDAEDKPDRKIELKPEASDLAEGFLREHEETRERLDRVSNLIAGFETPYGMELLSTVHWVATREGARTQDEVLVRTYGWGERKKMFKPDHVQVAWRMLKDKGWLNT